jgi:urease alpha subunit
MAVLVLQFFGGGKVYWARAVIATVSAGAVGCHIGSTWGCLGSSWVGIIRVARESIMGSDLVVEFYT